MNDDIVDATIFSVDFLISISNPNVSPEYELKKDVDEFGDEEYEKVSYRKFKEDIMINGIQDPLVIVLSRNTIRLEEGNHRIHVLKDLKIHTAPCIFKYDSSGIINQGNGHHTFELEEKLTALREDIQNKIRTVIDNGTKDIIPSDILMEASIYGARVDSLL